MTDAGAFDLNLSAVRIDDRTRDGEPQAEPAIAMMAGVVALLERVEKYAAVRRGRFPSLYPQR
jgi:hypothetical protein